MFWQQKSLCPPLTENEKLTSLMPDGSLALIETVKVSPGATVFCETEIEVISGPSLSSYPPLTVNVARTGELLQQLVLVEFLRESVANGMTVYVPPMTALGTVQL